MESQERCGRPGDDISRRLHRRPDHRVRRGCDAGKESLQLCSTVAPCKAAPVGHEVLSHVQHGDGVLLQARRFFRYPKLKMYISVLTIDVSVVICLRQSGDLQSKALSGPCRF